MNRKPTRIPADPWQWFSGCMYHLSATEIHKTWNVGGRTVERWSADKRTTQSVTKNPLVLLGETLEKLMEKGQADFAISAVDYLAEITRCHVIADSDHLPDHSTLEEELLDNYEVLANHTSTMQDPDASKREKRVKAYKVVSEILQDLKLLE